jgi:hypothetical protein
MLSRFEAGYQGFDAGVNVLESDLKLASASIFYIGTVAHQRRTPGRMRAW